MTFCNSKNDCKDFGNDHQENKKNLLEKQMIKTPVLDFKNEVV